MLTLEEFTSLEVGDHVETVALFPAMHPEPVVLQTAQVTTDRREFVVTYCGVTLGRWVCIKNHKGELKWQY